jgi:protein-L-isoaspartate(D-aspartate) O-methyltransferase
MAAASQTDVFLMARRAMVETQLRSRGIRDQRLLAAMERVPRHEFVPAGLYPQAYEDHPLPIGEGQTVSQPYIVAVTIEALGLEASNVVLEVGTGSGFQTALLAELTKFVYSIERHARLAAQAQSTLQRLGYSNVLVLVGDGSKGLPECAPYDAIAVSAAAPSVPQSLLQQLREGGRMVVPVGPAEVQQLQLLRKQNGQPLASILEGCRFVPLIGDEGYASPFPQTES